jgi:DNA-binding transcriptional ArsR family regulator
MQKPGRQLRNRVREGTVSERRNTELPAVDTAAPLQCNPVAAGTVSDVAAMEVAFRLRVLSHPVRIKLLSMLFAATRGEECGRVLANTIGLPETTISHHLRQLRGAGLIESRRRGMHVFHRPHQRALNALATALDPDIESSSAAEDLIGTRPIGDRTYGLEDDQ